jgi:hypothetical protein
VRLGDIDVLPTDGVRFPAAGTLDIDNLDNRSGYSRDTDMAAGFQHDRITFAEEGFHQRVNLLLFERLAAGYFDESGRISGDRRQYFVEWDLASAAI